MAPAQLQTLLKQAVAHHTAGRLDMAEQYYRRVRTAVPANFDALHLSGLVAYQQGRHREAAELLRRALKRNPASGVCEMRLGLACRALGELTVSERHLRVATEREPTLPEAWCNLAITLWALGRMAEARTAYERAITLKPDYAEAHDRLGALAWHTVGFAAAVPHFRRAAELEPNNATAWANLGAALTQSSGLGEALESFERALTLAPEHQLALAGRALAWQFVYRIPEAVAGYGEVLKKNPRHHEARSARLLALHYLDGVDRAALFAEHVAFGAACGEPLSPALPNSPDPSRRLRVAFLSADLRTHSVAFFLEPLLAHLDPTQFEVYLYHDHPQVDEMSAMLRTRSSLWRNFSGQAADAVEAVIRADAPDVLFDLAGHTGINRLPLFARRLAPVQITWLGYADTTGLPAMDYRFVDAITDPVGDAEPFHTEKLVRFAPTAWTFQPPVDAPEPTPPSCVAGAPVTFGCFNNFAKVSDSTLRGWGQVLAAVPGSRLLLKGHGLAEPALAAAMRARLTAFGVGQERVEMLGRTPDIAAHLALYARVDVALDTSPYHGTTTTCEALWMGCPVVTLQGDRHMSRVGASLLTAVGHPEWIAADWADYVRIAADLTSDPARLAALRTSLRHDLRRSVLLDHAGQAARFGAAVRAAWVAWCERSRENAESDPDASDATKGI
jgi:predicted O-linked N-acetylglucosamine transferase (SPINDLY family)